MNSPQAIAETSLLSEEQLARLKAFERTYCKALKRARRKKRVRSSSVESLSQATADLVAFIQEITALTGAPIYEGLLEMFSLDLAELLRLRSVERALSYPEELNNGEDPELVRRGMKAVRKRQRRKIKQILQQRRPKNIRRALKAIRRELSSSRLVELRSKRL